MTTTIARQARIRFADATAPLAQVVINARFAAIVADLITEIETDLDAYEPVDACETCANEYHLGYCAE
jgi:hypothetical protein